MTTSTQTTARELAELLRRRELSSVELTRATFAKIAEQDASLGAFVELDERRALAAAEAADRSLRAGGTLPPFLGVPTAIKDSEHVRFLHTRVGSRAFKWIRSPVDSKLAQRCRKAGFVIVGKTSTSELTILPFVHTDLGPPTCNPRAPEHYAGGSSGGAAAAVAAGMVPIAPGSDGAGSIRLPAAFCGLVGIKPGRGALFNEHLSVDATQLSAIGPLAHTVRDAAALMDVLDGRSTLDAPDSYSAATKQLPSKLRIRVGLSHHLTSIEPEIEAATRRAARQLELLGHHVEEGPPPPPIAVDEFLPIMGRLMANIPVLPFTSHTLQPTTRWMRELGKAVTRPDARRRHDALQAQLDAWFAADGVDAWLFPTCAVSVPKLHQYAGLHGEAVFRAVVCIGAFTAPFNITGQPALTLPAAVSQSGLPIGVQLVMKRNEERKLLGLAASLEQTLSPSRSAPIVAQRDGGSVLASR
ncbi:MAG TPA: amidase [Polyangiales bacterium]|nr:amidase [Polyangiales bacterium]